MSGPAKRKWLSAEAYGFLVRAALLSRAPRPASKSELAWETRANHYVITRVLRDLAGAGHIRIVPAGGGYEIHLTGEGSRFQERFAAYARSTFSEALVAHYRYGRRPPWADFASPEAVRD